MSLQWKWKILRKRAVTALIGSATKLVSDEAYTKIIYKIIFDRKLNLQQPQTYNEHISVLKLSSEAEELARFADKYEARAYISETIGSEYLIPLIGCFDSADEIEFDNFPESFVLKCTHGSSFNIVVPNKRELNQTLARRKLRKWLRKNYYHTMREKPYNYIHPRIMCDKFLFPSNGGALNEVKLYCINGIVRFIMDNYEENGIRSSNVYDREWERLNVTYGFPSTQAYDKPQNAQLLIELAEKLAKPFPFVRVDFYNVDEKIYFSELTFYPGGGMTPFNPDSFDYEMGRYFTKGVN